MMLDSGTRQIDRSVQCLRSKWKESLKYLFTYENCIKSVLYMCVVSADTVLNCLKYLLLMTDMHRELELTST